MREKGYSRRKDARFPWLVAIMVGLAACAMAASMLDMPTTATAFFVALGVIYLLRLLDVLAFDVREGESALRAWRRYRRVRRRARERVRERRARLGPSKTRGVVPERAPLHHRLQRLFDGWRDR